MKAIEMKAADITRMREQLGWSKAELSRQAAMNAADVGKIESGRVVAYPSQLEKIRAAFERAGVLDDE
jgi:ribosome-binding protein aMBF1 (putative translation factor)